MRRDYPGLAHAIAEISTPPLRNMGTLGGNVLLDTRCNYYDQNYEWRQAIDFCMKKDGAICWVAPGSPKCLAIQSADSVPVLIALRRARGARVRRTASARSPLEDLYRNDGIHYLTKRPGRAADRDPRPGARTAGRRRYRKLRRRGAFDFPVLSVGAAVRREGGRRGRGADRPRGRVVLGSGPGRRARRQLLVGRPLDADGDRGGGRGGGRARRAPWTTPISPSSGARR